jgi:CRP-like cAMP-binding protein
LPHRVAAEYRRNQVIYDEEHPPSGLSLIVDGRVKVTTILEDGSQTLTGIFGADEFFGELALHGYHPHRERATAMEKTSIMSWSAADIQMQIERQPKLGLALLQLLVGRCLDLEERLQCLACDKTQERVVWGLMHFAKSGTRQPDGAVCIPPLTHQLLSEYLGTSREIVTLQMNQMRRQGLLNYSRKAIQIYPDALNEHLRLSKVS